MRCFWSHFKIEELFFIYIFFTICAMNKTMQNAQEFSRVASPKFGHPALSSDSLDYTLNSEFVETVGMIVKK